jgi:2-polyprenyl-6-methoxyphenol hydroxylase-like FAD-dependent oxidoreductase
LTPINFESNLKEMINGIIIGAGIGGLTTAIALAQKGINVKIYERANEIKEVGAGIWVAPNGLKVFEKLGIIQDIINAGKTLKKISVVDLKYKPISTINEEDFKSEHKYGTVAIHRAILQKILASYIPSENIYLNKSFKHYHQTEKSVIATFEDGTTQEADFLINADGIKSNARLQIQSTLNLRYSGQTCWRFTTSFDLQKGEEDNMYEVWANAKGLRVGYSKIDEKRLYVFITNSEKQGGTDNPITLKEDLLKLCEPFSSTVKGLINSANKNEIIRTDLFDFKPVSKWTEGRVALIGDAAHATTPNLGQGACQAIEDAYVIAEQLSLGNDIAKSFKNFQSKRIKKATFITNTSWLFVRITNTSGFKKSLVKQILRLTPNFINTRQLNKIYSIE